MTLAPWRVPLARALHRNRSKPHSRYVQLATVDADGWPTVRTVVFRGFLEDCDRLLFVTDTRSKKAQHFQRRPQAEVCWYFTQTREQFRLRGKIQVTTATTPDAQWQAERQRRWQALSDAARQQFVWPEPAAPRSHPDFDFPAPDAVQPPETFALVALTPIFVDHLALRGSPQDRYHYTYGETGEWEVQVVNP
ncbi:MAG: pyridoxamine 5'-phosphate oxidase family protein [Leptolyngbyaceae cyanobacterium T60_A2020_046]|nr:pyridoxamine 5'-phosphate oxidase family protein [Leptolyngbyaceae cyanobacterium T60_A2020_046]